MPVDGGSHFGPSASLRGVPPLNFEAHAGLAPSLPLFWVMGVFWRELMTLAAMRSQKLGANARGYGDSDLVHIDQLLPRRNNLIKREASLRSINYGVAFKPRLF